MADRRQNRRNNSNKDEDYNPKFRKMYWQTNRRATSTAGRAAMSSAC